MSDAAMSDGAPVDVARGDAEALVVDDVDIGLVSVVVVVVVVVFVVVAAGEEGRSAESEPMAVGEASSLAINGDGVPILSMTTSLRLRPRTGVSGSSDRSEPEWWFSSSN